MEAIREQMEQQSSITSGPGHYALGRGYLALEEFAKAREHLELAWQSNYTEPEVA